MFSQDDSWKSVIEILDYFLFLVENYDYLRSKIIFWEEGHVVSSNFCALPPLLQASFISLKNKYKKIYFVFVFVGKLFHLNVFRNNNLEYL